MHIFLHEERGWRGEAAREKDGKQRIDVHLLCVMEGKRR